YGEPGGFGELTQSNILRFKGVQCEACHGPLKGHPNADDIHPLPITPDRCLGCHDEANSPNFEFESYLHRASCQAVTINEEP
ncbi:MAG: multiheme c-type cytochrome, partial [Myxococcota bacterium]|nr:multiheme c-type cytochrome [Myxococcota bacterium]